MARRKEHSKIPPAKLTADQRAELDRIELEAFLNFKGSFDDLERAIGMLRLGHHVGWKALVVIHSKRTVVKYEEILGVKVRDIFPPEGPSYSRSVGYSIARKLENFWKAVSGEVSVEGRKELT